MTDTGSIRISQGLDVLQPKSGEAYPIPCQEWDSLKERLGRLDGEPWMFAALASLLLGAFLSTLISIVIGGIGTDPQGRNIVIAWAVVVITGVSSILSGGFAIKERTVHRERATDILTTMNLLEQRFKRHEG